jgi:cation transport ATPase
MQSWLRTIPDVSSSIQLARKVRAKIKQNLFWAAIYNLIAIPIAAGMLYPSFGLLLPGVVRSCNERLNR